MKMVRKLTIFLLVGLCFVVESENVADRAEDQSSDKITYPNDFQLQHNHGSYHHRPADHSYRAFPPGFQHSPAFHSIHGNVPRNFHHSQEFHHKEQDFPPEIPENRVENPQSDSEEEFLVSPVESEFPNSTLSIPLDFIKNISQYSVDDLLLNFVEGDMNDGEEKPLFASRFGGEDDVARNAAVIPKSAGCIPEFRTLKLASTEDPSILYIPQCTRVEQCGGCCSHPLLDCQPIESETLAYQVIKTQYTGNKKLKILGKETMFVEKHTKCKCDCKVKAENCNQYQEYRKAECRCACKNTDDEKKCYKSGTKKLWNPELCSCQCRNVTLCTTGSYFDQNECKCMTSAMKRRYATYNRQGYNSEAVTIIPLGEDDY